jgi:hypothetical protein
LFNGHRVDQSLISIPQVCREPNWSFGKSFWRPLAIRKVYRGIWAVLLWRIRSVKASDNGLQALSDLNSQHRHIAESDEKQRRRTETEKKCIALKWLACDHEIDWLSDHYYHGAGVLPRFTDH